VSEVTGTVGQVLAERYRLLTLLGRGGMGCVWRAEHLSLGTPVAIKLIHR
jgi:serine/threonine-protein kinase